MDWQKAAARLLNWGTPLLVAGALLCFLSGKLTARAPEKNRDSLNLALKAAGLVISVIGALRIFNIV